MDGIEKANWFELYLSFRNLQSCGWLPGFQDALRSTRQTTLRGQALTCERDRER